MTAANTPTPEELAMLSDSERAGLLAEIEDEKLRTAEGDGDGAGDGDGDTAQEPGAQPAAAQPSPAPAPAAPKPAELDAATDAVIQPTQALPGDLPSPAPAPALSAAPAARPFVPDWQMPENAETRLQEIDAKLDKIAQDADAGELTLVEANQQTRQLNAQRRALEQDMFKATFTTDTIKAGWKATVTDFFEGHTEYADGSSLRPAFEQELRKLQVGKTVKEQTNPELLAQADTNLRQLMGLPARAAKPADGRSALQVKTGQRTPAPTLAHVPASDVEDLGGENEFAHIDKLKGAELENAIGKLTPDQRTRYEEGA